MGAAIVGVFPGFCILFRLLGFLGGAYRLILFGGISHGVPCSSLSPRFSRITKFRYLGLFHRVPLVLLFFFPLFV